MPTESSPETMEKPQSLDSAIESARKWQRRFWGLCLVWLVVAGAVSVAAAISVRNFERSQSSIRDSEKEAKYLVARAEKSTNQMEELAQKSKGIQEKFEQTQKDAERLMQGWNKQQIPIQVAQLVEKQNKLDDDL